MFVRIRHGDAEAYTFCHSGNGRNAVQRVVDGELSSGRNSWFEVRRPFVDVVASRDIGEEDGLELRCFELLGENLPMLDVVVF